MYFVAGITGNVGGATARHLLESGRKVRALVRNPGKAAAWAEKGVELIPGDLNDANALAGALQGVEGAYVMLPPIMTPAPGFPEAKALIASLVEALGEAPVPRLVVLSSIGSEKTSGLGLITTTHLLEEALRDAGFPVAFIRAGSFLENYVGGVGMAKESGVFYTFYSPTDRAVPMIATEDIGKEAARLLVEGWNGKKVVELGSPASADDLAKAMGEVLGRTVRAEAVPREQWRATLASFGMTSGTEAFEEMTDGINSGWIDFGVEGAERVAGTLTPVDVFRQAKG